MKKVEVVKQIFEAAGHPCNFNRRNRWFKALSEILESGLITFKVCEIGKHWFEGDYKWNISIHGCGQMMRFFKKSGSKIDNKILIEPYDVLRIVGKFLQSEVIKQRIISHVNLDLKCDRCCGQGRIERFHYYCDGICFECYGSGYSAHKKTEVKILEAKAIPSEAFSILNYL